MKTDDALALFGSVRQLASALSMTPQAVYQWGDVVPQLREYQIRERFPDFDRLVAAMKSRRAA